MATLPALFLVLLSPAIAAWVERRLHGGWRRRECATLTHGGNCSAQMI